LAGRKGRVFVLTGDGESVTIGRPLVDGAVVVAEVLEQKKSPKVNVFKFKRRKNYIRKKSHRQNITILKVTSIK